jgi:hypothetical protein
MSKCKKQSNRKNLEVAKATTRANQIRKCESLLRKHPRNIAVINKLAQLRYDSGVK